MKSYLGLFLLLSLVLSSFILKKEEWIPLLDKDLSQWDMYLSYRHQPGYKGEQPVDDKGEALKPIGYNQNVSNVFTVIEEKGQPVLKVSGEIYGCVFTKKSYENYHLKLQVRWGQKKWIPRLDEDMDSGILYHSQGECGVDYWRSWMMAQEFQIIEKSMGDYWNIASSAIDIRAVKNTNNNFQFLPKAPWLTFASGAENGNFCQSKSHTEKKNGQWNTLELICFEDKSLHIVNGKVVMALSKSRYLDGTQTKPLTSGKIQLQSEAAEVFFKDVMIRPITGMPKAYASYFE